MRGFSGLDDLAAAGAAVVVYPAGTGSREGILTWNGGNCCGEAVADGSDDVGFAAALVDAVAGRLPIDPLRVHATGMSNGAMMAYRVAAELADRIAAVAPVAGPNAFAPIAPSRPVPVLHFHGTLDEFTPYAGGVGKRSITRVAHRSAEESVAPWVEADGCDECLTGCFGRCVVVADDDDLSDYAVLDLCEVCHYATTNVPVVVHEYHV